MSSIPHKCPVCEGSGVYVFVTIGSHVPTRETDPCHACSGTGVLWRFESQHDGPATYYCAQCGFAFRGSHTCPTLPQGNTCSGVDPWEPLYRPFQT